MRHLLTIFLAFHWTAVFALLAMVCAIDVDGGVGAALDLLGITGTDPYAGGGGSLGVAGLFAVLFGVVAVLFFWAFVTAFFGERMHDGDTEEVLKLAFASAAGALSLVLLAGAVMPVAGLFLVVACHLAALFASYLAVFAERWSASVAGDPGRDDVRAAARIMALGAAHSSLLSRISRREDAGERR